MRRRRFVQVVSAAAGTAMVPGCASFVAVPVRPENGEIRLVLRNHAQLEQPGGSLKIRPGQDAPVLYVLALDGGEYTVLSPICTHLQCTVNIDGPQLLCPCHGSAFDRTGRVLRGPAMQPLERFPARVTSDGELVIRYRGAA